MNGKSINTGAFAAFIAVSAAALALILIIGGIIPTALLLRSRKADENAATDEALPALENAAVSIYTPERDGEVIRLHIIANSDSAEDQRVKLLVRDAVLSLAHLGNDVLSLKNANAAERLLKRSGQPLLETVREVLEREGARYDAQLLIGDFEFPDREYDGKLYPAGKYRALRILLGDAGGKNWWCILFPPLCIINTDENASNTRGRSMEAEQANTQNGRSGETERQIHFESLIVRLFNTIFCGDCK